MDSDSMTTTVLLFVLAGMGLILLVMMVLFGNKGLLISQNFDETETVSDPGQDDDNEEEKAQNIKNTEQQENSYQYHNHYTPDEKTHAETPKHATADTQTETAFVIRKADERLRMLDEFHHSSIQNEKYALIFQREDGSEFQLSCSKAAHSKIPYRVTGTVTFRNQKLLRFESEKETVSDEYSIIAS